ncbi:MAG: hypothetical protein AAGM38_18855 [Pseudomonadota bacterium]
MVSDFKLGQDKLVISAALAGRFEDLQISTSGQGSVISFAGGTVRLTSVKSGFDADDVVFVDGAAETVLASLAQIPTPAIVATLEAGTDPRSGAAPYDPFALLEELDNSGVIEPLLDDFFG